jgi:hypothetical protein
MLKNLINIYQHVDIYKGYFSNMLAAVKKMVLEIGGFQQSELRPLPYF